MFKCQDIESSFLVFLLLFWYIIIYRGNIGYSTGGSDVIRGAGVLHDPEDDDDDSNFNATEPLQQKAQRKDSPPSYNGHCMYGFYTRAKNIYLYTFLWLPQLFLSLQNLTSNTYLKLNEEPIERRQSL